MQTTEVQQKMKRVLFEDADKENQLPEEKVQTSSFDGIVHCFEPMRLTALRILVYAFRIPAMPFDV